jgi:hypothetical protein
MKEEGYSCKGSGEERGTMKGEGVKEPCRKREMAERGQRRGTMKEEGREEPYRKEKMVVRGQRMKGEPFRERERRNQTGSGRLL